MSKPPSLQDVKTEMELSKAYRGIFPEIFKIVVLHYKRCLLLQANLSQIHYALLLVHELRSLSAAVRPRPSDWLKAAKNNPIVSKILVGGGPLAGGGKSGKSQVARR